MFQQDANEADVPDDELIARAVAQEPAALAQLYRRYDRYIRASLHLHGPGRPKDDSVVAEMFWSALQHARVDGPRGRTFHSALTTAILAAHAQPSGGVGAPGQVAEVHTPQVRLRGSLVRLSAKERRRLWQQYVEKARDGSAADTDTTVERLRQTYLEEFLDDELVVQEPTHRAVRQLVGLLLGSLSARVTARTRAHLDGCGSCSAALGELEREDGRFRALDLRAALLDLAPFLLAGRG